MTTEVTRAVEGAIKQAELAAALATVRSGTVPLGPELIAAPERSAPAEWPDLLAAPRPPDTPPVAPHVGRARRVARRTLRAIRPVLAPLLHRFEWRVRTAVDKSSFAADTSARLATLERSADTASAVLSHVAGQIDLVRDDLATMRVEIAAQTAASSHSHRAEASAYQAALLDCVMNVAERLTRIETAQVELLRHAEFTASGFTNQLGALAEQTAHLVQMGRGVVPLGVGSEGSDFLVRSPSGWLIVPGEDERLLTAMVETGGVLERGTTAVVAALLRPGDTIIDVGAHIGTLTLPAARKVGATGRVIAVEPASRALGALRRTLHLNGLSDRVELHHWAAGAAEAEAKLRLSPVLGESTLVEGPDAEVSATATVAIRPLDALTHPGPVRLVKIDVEGYEMAVWQGMQRLLDRDPDLAVIIEFGPSHLARAGVPETSWFEALTSNGFAVWEIDQVSAVLRPLRPAGERSGILSINLLLLRRPISAYAGLVVADKQPAPA